MQFKYPELLFALFLLIVPILIHLFQLRRFQKVAFTNVAFLKAVKLQTRKSSQLKKWLTLLSRMLLLACAIVAFAQPFIPNTEDFNETQETVIYLDNSFSMQANGKNGTLLNEAIQDIISTLPEDETISIFTNDRTFRNTTLKAIKNDLIQTIHSPKQLNYSAAYLKGKALFTNSQSAKKNLLLVSDFQQKNEALSFKNDSTLNLNLVQLKANVLTNVSIDSAYIANKDAETLDLAVSLSNTGESINNVTVSLLNNDNLLAKNAVELDGTSEARFSIPNNQIINGKIIIEDLGLQYDNSFYFNINAKEKIKVLAVNEDADADFLKRIYTNADFDFQSYNIKVLNFNLIPDQNLIVLNELNNITPALNTALLDFVKDGGHILIIPSNNIDLNSYNQLFNSLSFSELSGSVKQNKRITGINYDHPLLDNTFYDRVKNFQYPKVEKSYAYKSQSNTVLLYDDDSAFLIGNSNVFAFASALNKNNSNFKNSPLIVPVLYNIGVQSLKLPKLYYTVGTSNAIAVKANLGQDDILTLSANEVSVIPLQKTFSTSVIIETEEFPTDAGILKVKNEAEVLQNLSFNYDRSESALNYHSLDNFSFANVETNVSNSINTIKSSTTINALWKWFVIFALVFLVIEILLLKYLK